jgi:hypothetical protein
MSRTIFVAGSGRCGLASLVGLLNRQPGTQATLEEPPLLPWIPADPDVIRRRLERMRRARTAPVIADAAAFYLPYLDGALEADPGLVVVGLWRPREEVVASFGRFLDEHNAFPTDHWSDEPAEGRTHDPLWTRTFPQYPVADRAEGIRRYWDEYYQRFHRLASRHPKRVRLFDMRSALNNASGQQALLDFAGYARGEQVLALGLCVRRVEQARPYAARPSTDPLDPARCAVLVPYAGFVHPPCENGLRELERRGYAVRRVGGYAAIDQGRNQMATDALLDGFAETMWIDSDVEFRAEDVDRLRRHGLPICCGIYPQKGRKALACHVMPGADRVTFGRGGGLQELLFAAAGFLHVRREAYLRVQHALKLPVANERFGSAMIPFFLPMLLETEDGQWYLAEDYAFSERARRAGHKLMADTSIRLWHHGGYGYGWEDAGLERERVETFTLHFPDKPAGAGGR